MMRPKQARPTVFGQPQAERLRLLNTEPASLPLFEPGLLDELVGDDLEEARQIVELFDQSTESQVEELEDAARRGDVALFASVVHSFKGSAGIIGATRLHHQLAALEARADAEPLSGLVQELQSTLRDTVASMNDWIASVAVERP